MRKLLLTSFFMPLVLLLITSFNARFLLPITFFNTGIFAATTGKVQGTVIDAESKDPLPGVNVILEGTAFGAATDENGFYFIINLPPGTYQLKTSMVGYSTETTSDVRIYVDRTTTQDITLQSSAIVGEEVTVTATRVPVPLDVSSTESYITGEDVVESPAGRFDELMGYQAGVEFANTDNNQDGRGFEIRGGMSSESDVQIDGISTMNRMSQAPAIPLSRNLIQDVQILTGGFNAEYGNIRSGLINVITKDGSYNRYSGIVEGRISPTAVKHFGPSPYDDNNEWCMLFLNTGSSGGVDNPAFNGVPTSETYDYKLRRDKDWNYYTKWSGFNAYAKDRPYGAQFYYDMAKWQDRDIPYSESPDIMADLSGGGPVPFVSNTKFYTSFFWNRSEYALMASRDRSHEYNASFKITHRLKSNMVLVFSALETNISAVGGSGTEMSEMTGAIPHNYMTGDDLVMFSGSRYFNPARIFEVPGHNLQFDKTHSFNFKFTHTCSPSTYYELTASAQLYDSDLDRMRNTDPTPVHWITDDKTGETKAFDEYPWGWTLRGYNYDGITYGRRDPFRMEHRGSSKTLHDNYMNDFSLKADIVSQFNKANQIKAGFLISRTHISETDHYVMSVSGSPITVRPYEWCKFKADPWQAEFYAQDKLEWEGMIVNFGVRGLAFFPGTKGLNLTSENMFAYDENLSPIWNSTGQWGSVEGEGNWMWQEMRTRKINTKLLLQPRLGISHPITESSKIFFNYGHFINSPHPQNMFEVMSAAALGGGQDWGKGLLSGIIGIPDLEWPKVIAYEIGYSQSIYNQFLLQISGYYKDYTNDIATRRALSYAEDVNLYMFANSVYRDVMGLEFRIERSFGRFINGWANYNYMIRSSGTTGFETIYQDPTLEEYQYFTSEQDRPQTRPTFRLNLSLRTPVGWGPGNSILGVKPLAEWRVNLLYRLQDGGMRLMNSGDPPKDWIYVDYTNIKMYDLYITKRVARGIQFYCQAKNVFNIKRLRQTGGSYRDSLHLWFETGDQNGNDKIGDYKKDYIYTYYAKWRTFYPENRDIYFGIRYQF